MQLRNVLATSIAATLAILCSTCAIAQQTANDNSTGTMSASPQSANSSNNMTQTSSTTSSNSTGYFSKVLNPQGLFDNQFGSFNGFFAKLGGGFQSISTKIENHNDSDSITLGNNGVLGQLSVGYSYYLGAHFNIAAYAFDALNLNYNNSAGNIVDDTLNLKQLNLWGLGIQPGYYLAQNTLLYADLFFAQGRFQLSDTDGDANTTVNNNGIGYGFGIQHLITPNLFLGASVAQILFQNSTGNNGVNIKPTETLGLLSVGYLFK